MTRSIALLRGINVGGSRKVAMADVRAACVAAGASDVATYIQSGNVVLTHRSLEGAALEAALHAALRDATGLDIAVLARSAAEWTDVIARNPYPDAGGTQLVVWFLRDDAAGARLAAVDAAPFAPETFTVHSREAYLLLPNGQARSALTVALGKVRPAVELTARNWNTVTKLAVLAEG